jgi:hypothetical protein
MMTTPHVLSGYKPGAGFMIGDQVVQDPDAVHMALQILSMARMSGWQPSPLERYYLASHVRAHRHRERQREITRRLDAGEITKVEAMQLGGEAAVEADVELLKLADFVPAEGAGEAAAST